MLYRFWGVVIVTLCCQLRNVCVCVCVCGVCVCVCVWCVFPLLNRTTFFRNRVCDALYVSKSVF